ncbi:MAG TPA: hypothetical protein VGO11_09845 [Chthoniobacteraceae bacterium]|nr:hypothetical protein [Chthoniobacteraceae bacterium]
METLYSSTHPPIDLARFWQRRTRGVRRFVNAAWFVEAILPNLFLASLVVTAAILVARRQGWNDRFVAGIGLALGLAAMGVAYGRARRHFISEPDARAKIESGLRLHTRLSAAAAGVGSWPEAERWHATPWRWHWRKLAVLPLCSAAILIAALLLPIVPNVEHAKPPIAKPPALEKVETMLEKLAATPAIEPASIEAVQQEAQQLAKQDPADWYSHATLEAADHLKSKLESGLKTLGDNAAKLEKLLGQNPAEAGAAWNEKLQGALSALQGNVPGLNSELAKALGELDPSKLKTLTPEQLEQLKEALGEAQKAAGKGKGDPEDQGEGEGESTEEGEGAGNGGVDRGPGTAPLKLGTPAELGTKTTEGLPSEDLRHAALGDALGMSAGQHEVDKSKQHRAADGGAAAAGEGAGAVWQQQHVTPEERKRLQQFFQ